ALSASSIILGDGFDLIVILIVTGVFALCERRRIDSYGLPINEAFGGLFWNGVVAGLAVVALLRQACSLPAGCAFTAARCEEPLLSHRRCCCWSGCHLSAILRSIFSAVTRFRSSELSFGSV